MEYSLQAASLQITWLTWVSVNNSPRHTHHNPTERANRTVKTMIAQFAGQVKRNWDEKWSEIMLAVNTSTSESTGRTPAFLTQGREPLLPSSLYDKETLGTGRVTEILEENANKIREVFKIVQRNMEKASQRYQKDTRRIP